jgi:hypothetical protein
MDFGRIRMILVEKSLSCPVSFYTLMSLSNLAFTDDKTPRTI